jgi:hypothetical protein
MPWDAGRVVDPIERATEGGEWVDDEPENADAGTADAGRQKDAG